MDIVTSIANIQGLTALGVCLIFGMGAFGTAIGFALFFVFANPFVGAVTSAAATAAGAK